MSTLNSRQLINHFEHHQLITEKYNLLLMLQKQADLQKENVFDITPITFYVEMPNVAKESAYNTAMAPFLQYFQVLEDNKKVIKDLKGQLSKLKDIQVDPQSDSDQDQKHDA